MTRTFISGASLVLPDRVATGHTLVVEGDRIVDVINGPRRLGDNEVLLTRDGQVIVPGFIDVHVHGAAGTDVLDGPGSVARVAATLPRWGVTAFCPTTVACDPARLDALLTEVSAIRASQTATPAHARVLPAHLESNFISPDFHGAQPITCLRQFDGGLDPDGAFSSADIVRVFDDHQPDLGIVTLAPERGGGMDLLRKLVAAGIRVSIGHSGATYEEAVAAIEAGASHATHLFNQMSPMLHRQPGLVGAVLAHEEIAAEIICDGHHVKPAVLRVAVAAKSPSRMMAITDGTAGSGLPLGSRTRLGGMSITVAEVARLDDGTTAGSVLTMDRAFGGLVTFGGLDLVRAVEMCSTTPARELGLHGFGALASGATADFVILDPALKVAETWVGGRKIWEKAN
jgi:N-acetylglucosamine-6-phosphate deacetylase